MGANGCIIRKAAPEECRLGEVEVRLATPCERPRRDAAMDECHYLGFRRIGRPMAFG